MATPIANLRERTQPPATAAERGLVDGFAVATATLPGKDWVGRLRASALAGFQAQGLPTRRVESFKYTDLRERLKDALPAAIGGAAVSVTQDSIAAALGPLARVDAHRLVLVDGAYRADLSHVDGLEAGVEVLSLAGLLQKAPGWLEGKFARERIGERSAITDLNDAFMSDGVMIKVGAGLQVAKPVMLVQLRTGADARMVTTRHVVAMETGAAATLIEVAVAMAGASPRALGNTLSDVTVADGAKLSHVMCVVDQAGLQHLSRWAVTVGGDAGYRGFQLTAGPGLVRHDITVAMEKPGSTLDVSGALLARGTAHIDTTLVVDHMAPGCESRELFKAVLDDRARGVFQGKIIVRPGADKTDGKQMARALMLSEDAEFDSKPELEIYADDVACGHGATAAALDDDLMFYCQSRGISEADARVLLIEAFVGDAMAKVENEGLREALMDIARGWLAGRAERSAGEPT